jgi:3-oxoacyl-[acyl-carrier protein] reductase
MTGDENNDSVNYVTNESGKSSASGVRPALEGRVAVVTGAASGIGKAIAATFAAAGAAVMLADVNEELGQSAVKEIQQHGASAAFFRLDVGEREEMDALLASTQNKFGPVGVMANIAGVSGRRVHGALPLMDVTDDDFFSLMRINVLSVITGTQAAARIMRENGGGAVINASSGSIDIPGEGVGLYAMSKAAIAMLTKTFAVELGPYGIRVNALAPGLTRTAYFDRHFDLPTGSDDAEAFFADNARRNPLGRNATAQDNADLALFLVSDSSAYINGQIVRTNGGAQTPW